MLDVLGGQFFGSWRIDTLDPVTREIVSTKEGSNLTLLNAREIVLELLARKFLADAKDALSGLAPFVKFMRFSNAKPVLSPSATDLDELADTDPNSTKITVLEKCQIPPFVGKDIRRYMEIQPPILAINKAKKTYILNVQTVLSDSDIDPAKLADGQDILGAALYSNYFDQARPSKDIPNDRQMPMCIALAQIEHTWVKGAPFVLTWTLGYAAN